MTMTATNTPLQTDDIRELSAAELGEAAGGAVSLGGYIRRLIWQIQNAPENSTLVGCSDDMRVCEWISN
jgi:hypothetical protein